ncbi:MAG TPA: hypothetical protein VKY51_04615 [Fredinandcohnia sp.]|nr:hypothetical protein [Fredinandcohnia sp.]
MAEEEIKKQLDSIVARAAEAFAEVRDAVVRTSQLGKLKIDEAFLRREQEKAHARLGAKVYELVEDGELELPEEARPLLEAVRSLAEKLEKQQREIAEVERG